MMKVGLILTTMLVCIFAGLNNAHALDKDDLSALQAAVHSICVQPDSKGDYLQLQGDLSAGGAILRVLGVNAGAKVTREQWEGISRRLDKYKEDPRQCAVETLKLLLPLYHSGGTRLDAPRSQQLLRQSIDELSDGILDESRYYPSLTEQIRLQLPAIQNLLAKMGALKTLKLVSSETGPQGILVHHFVSYHDNGALRWDISAGADGTINGLYVVPLR